MSLYVSLDEARSELRRRWQDVELKRKVERFQGKDFLPFFGKTPRAYFGKSLPTPDNGFGFFMYCAQYVRGLPLAPAYYDDKFVSINSEKKNLVIPFVALGNSTRGRAHLADIGSEEGKPIKEVVLRNGEKLIDFHLTLFARTHYCFEFADISGWFQQFGSPINYYFYYLCHFVAHGVLFETFYQTQYAREIPFTNNIVLPAINKIKEEFGIKPLIVRLYPEELSPIEEFYWCSYPPAINNQIVEYAEKNKMRFRELSHSKYQEPQIKNISVAPSTTCE